MAVGNTEVKSSARDKTTDPRWEERYQFLIHDPRHQDLNVEVCIGTRRRGVGMFS